MLPMPAILPPFVYDNLLLVVGKEPMGGLYSLKGMLTIWTLSIGKVRSLP